MAWFMTLLVIASQLTFPSTATASSLGSSTQSAGSAPPPAATAIQSFQPDLFTGRATSSIPLGVPPGRKGVQPSLALAYASSARNGMVGVGWSLDVGAIERSTKNGVPHYTGSDTFTLMLQGVSSDLVQIADGTYRAKDEGAFLHIANTGAAGWEVRDKSGTRYFFGQTSASQMENGGQIFLWALDKVLDPTGNALTVSYLTDQHQLYPSQILYTAHEPTNLAPANEVDFLYETRPDVENSSRSGFSVTTAQRLRAVEAKTTVNNALQLARRYILTYTQSQRTSRSLLASVTQLGSDGATSLPPTTFTYQDSGAPTYPTILTNNGSSPSVAAWNVRHANLDTGHDNFGCVSPYAGLPWGAPIQTSGSYNLDGSVWGDASSNGDLTMSGNQDHFGHAWVYVYVTTAKTISLNLANNGEAQACLSREDSSGVYTYPESGSMSVSLQAGWSIIHLTSYHQHSGWGPATLTGSLISQVDIMNPAQLVLAAQLTGDVDGNATSDLITFNATTGNWTVSCATSCTLGNSGTWLEGFVASSGSTVYTPLLGDWNGDSKTDVAAYHGGSWVFASNIGMIFQAGNPSAMSFGSGIPLVGDFNGDGISDIGTYNSGSWSVALGTGSGFSPTGSLSLAWGDGNGDPITGDFNGDGLTDIGLVDHASGNTDIRLSTGTSWTSAATWIGGFGGGLAHTSADFNGDGLSDVAYYSNGQVTYAPSRGTFFGASITLPVTFDTSNDQLQVGDFNGDGIADPAVFNVLTNASQLALSSGTTPDLLSTITNGLGGTTTITYQNSSTLTNTHLPFVTPVVQQATVSDGLGHSYTTTYTYQGGVYDAASKEFWGFAQADVRDVDANLSTTLFHQDAVTKGRPSHTEFRDANGTLWTASDQTWSSTEPYPGVHVVQLTQTDAVTSDGDATAKHTRSRFTYDAYGNLTRTDDDGDVNVSGDERAATTTFIYNTTDWILGKPQLTQTLDVAGTVVAQKRFYYDGATDPAAPPSVGLLTKEEEWLVEDPLNPTNPQWLATAITYDPYGNVATVTDALTRTTTNTYDATTHTYLITITNALNHTRHLTYDPRSGQVLTSTDQNNVTTTTDYDALGRVTDVLGPNDSAALPTIRYEYDLSTVPIRTTVHARIQSGQPEELTTYTFSDGMGRTIQTRAPAEDPAKQVVNGAVEFNNKGQVVKQWVPYYDASSSAYVPVSQISGLAPPVQYTYDVMGRLLTTTDPDGSVSSATYNDWVVTATDALGHQTRRTSDAHGRLVKVEEINQGHTYTTTYTYDSLNNLATVTDHANHVTTLSYDSLSRKRHMADPDMGTWSYTYDAVDDLLTQTDARGVTMNFQYDALNRLTQKSYTVPSGSTIANPGPVAYTYDDANNQTQLYAKGRLTDVAEVADGSRFEYDNQGRLTKEIRTVDGTLYAIQRSYDVLGRLTTLTYPDGDVVSYTYNNQGGIETITLTPQANSPVLIVSNVDYNAAGQITKIVYGNGVATDYSYNPQTLRLQDLQSTGPVGALQQFHYQFDALGNVTQITDSVHTATQTFGYDDLSRLTSATGSYGALSYAYDPVGNMLEKEGVQMAYGENGAPPHAVTSTSDGWTMTYDVNGNLIRKEQENASLTAQILQYDTENRLVRADTSTEETVQVSFQPGWNFFSLPVIPNDPSIAALFPNFSADLEQLARRDDATGAFQQFIGIAKFNDFTALEYGRGYQLYCKNPNGVTLSFTGKTPTQTLTKPAQPGWHLLPGLGLQQWTLPQAFNGLVYDDVLRYDTASSSLTTAQAADAGQSYYVEVASSSTWSPPLPKDITTSFVYDGDGGRTKQITPSGTTKFLGESLEIDPAGVVTKYLFAGSQRIASITPVPSGSGAALPGRQHWWTRAWQHGTWSHFARAWERVSEWLIPTAFADPPGMSIHYYLTDHLGSSNVVTDQTGALVQQLEYTPYGSVHVNTGSVDVAHKFTGQRHDASTGLYFYHARYYDPQLGRFTSPDSIVQAPTDPQTLNRYSYVRDNPLNNTDPTGQSFWSKFFGAIAGIFVTIITGGCVACGIAAFSFLDTTISSLQAGASWGTALSLGTVNGLTAGYAAVAAPIIGAPMAFAGAGAGQGVADAAIVGQDVGHAAWVGAVAGLTTYVAGPIIGGGVGSSLNGGSFGRGATEGAYSVGAVLTIAYTAQAVAQYRTRTTLANRYRQDLGQVRALSLKATDRVDLTAGARPVAGVAGHRYDAAPNGNRFEMGPFGPTRSIATSNTVDDLTVWGTSKATQTAIAAGATQTATVNVSASGFVTSMALYEAYFGGQPYNAFSYNSNFAADSAIYGAGGPDVNLGFTPSFSDN